jgi:hypothetical protein
VVGGVAVYSDAARNDNLVLSLFFAFFHEGIALYMAGRQTATFCDMGVSAMTWRGGSSRDR